ncbi:MAG TPA: pyridoxal-dependent decarboxylase [Thermoanaerobaculia bacterium]
MTPEEFRRWGRALVDWIADYRERVEELPVLSRVEPGEVRSKLPAAAPEEPERLDAILRDLDEIVLPGITHWQSPNFFAYFPSNASLPSVLGDLVSTGLGVQGMLWATSPACTELETHVLDWLVGALGLPEGFLSSSDGGGVIQDTASSAVLCALVAARERAAEAGAALDRMTCYTSDQAHSSIEKAVRIAGLGAESLRLIETDDLFRMRPEALAEAMVEDRRAGRVPVFVCATVGTTSSLAIDPVDEIAAVIRDARGPRDEPPPWLHVDAAMAGTAALCPEHRAIHRGVEHADSYCFNPHKWMFTAFDCDAFWVRDRAALVRSLSVLPEYLRNTATESGKVIDYRDWHVPLGRRFRALKLWFVLRAFGLEGLRRRIRHHLELAERFASWVEADERFELVVPRSLTLVCFRLRGEDGPNEALLGRLNASGALFLTHTRLNDRYTLRMSIGQTETEERHVRAAWERIRAEADRLL